MRDYAREMRELIDKLAVENYAPPMVAAQIVTHLRAMDPDLLQGWLDAQAVSYVRDAINRRDAAVRMRNRFHGRRQQFAEAAARHEAGDSDALTSFMSETYPTKAGGRKILAIMEKDDLIFVASNYARRERESALQRMFLEAVAARLDEGQTVADLYTEDQLAAMWSSLINS